jgi:hypothetical protein
MGHIESLHISYYFGTDSKEEDIPSAIHSLLENVKTASALS